MADELTAHNWVMASEPFVMWGTLVVFNVAAIKLLQVTFRAIDLKDVLREKSVPQPTQVKPGTLVIPADTGVAAAPAVAPADNTSFSRVSGMVGSIVLAAFVWGLGNIVIYKAFANADDITKVLNNMANFFLAAAALFSPYAFKSLSEAFKGK